MKILYVLKAFPVVSQTFILNEVKGLLERGHQIKIISLTGVDDVNSFKQEPNLKNLEVIYLSQSSGFDYLRNTSLKAKLLFRLFSLSLESSLNTQKIISSLKSEIIEFSPDLIYSHFATIASEVACVLSRKFSIPFVFSAHGYDIFEEPSRYWHEILKTSHSCLVYSNYSKDFIAKTYGGRGKVSALNLGVDTDLFSPAQNSSDKFTIISVARLVEKKGQKFLIQACANLRSRGHDFQCIIVGEGENRRRLEELVVKLGLSEVVRFEGKLGSKEIAKLMQTSNVHVLPSLREPFGIASIEAMSVGLPVVVPNVMGSKEIVLNSGLGFLLDPGDVDSLTVYLEEIISDVEISKQFLTRGREFVVKKHSNQVWIDSVEDKLINSIG